MVPCQNVKLKINKPPSLAGLVVLRGLGPGQQTAWTPKVIGKEPACPPGRMSSPRGHDGG